MDSVERDSNAKQKFDLLYGSLCEIQKSLLDSTAKVAGFLLLATGWIATSSEARAFLKEDDISRYLAATALVGSFIFFTLAATKAHLASVHTIELLIKLGYVPQEYS
jgi:TRAP-type C4-dicarboxylate transport system permease small subunit